MSTIAPLKAFQVPSGKDRFESNQMMIWGLLPLSIKLSGSDTNGEILLFEHRNILRAGPPRHIHFHQDEWFYVIHGTFKFELGDTLFHLAAGDTLFAPRQIPHGWTHVGDIPGTLLTMVSPVGDFEKFILDTTRHATLPKEEEVAKAFTDHGMKIVGPPLDPH